MSLLSELAFDRAPRTTTETGLVTELLAFDRTSARSFDVDGRMRVAVCNLSKATVNPYYGREIPGYQQLRLDPDRVYKLYRDPSELAKGAATFNGLQLLDDHLPVDANDPKLSRTAGAIGTNCRFEAPYLKSTVTVWTKPSIDAIVAKKKAQLSCSYRYRPDMTPGISPEGLDYDGVMRDIVGNHVALVREGRAGPDVCVNDSLPIGILEMYKYPSTVAVAAAVLALTADQQIAFDNALDAKAKDSESEKEEANDARECSLDEREEAMDAEAEKADTEKKDEVARGDRKRARDARKGARDKKAADRAKDKAARDKAAKDLEIEGTKKSAEIHDKAKDGISQAQLDEAVKRASDEAVARVEARETAKREVLPLVGPITVAMDSAEAVYRFALDKSKVAHKDIHASALPAVVAAEIRARSVKTSTAPAAALASDGMPFSIDSIFKPAA